MSMVLFSWRSAAWVEFLGAKLKAKLPLISSFLSGFWFVCFLRFCPKMRLFKLHRLIGLSLWGSLLHSFLFEVCMFLQLSSEDVFNSTSSRTMILTLRSSLPLVVTAWRRVDFFLELWFSLNERKWEESSYHLLTKRYLFLNVVKLFISTSYAAWYNGIWGAIRLKYDPAKTWTYLRYDKYFR